MASSSKTYFGVSGLRGPAEGFAKRFDLVELDVLDRTPVVRDATMRKWRKDVGPSFQFSVVAPKIVSAVRPGPSLDEGLERLLQAQRILQARFILLATPIEVTPAALPRERLAKLVARIREGLGEARSIVRIAWQPRGVWEAAAAAHFARELGIDLCIDPFADPYDPFWDPTIRYLRLSTIGGRTAFPPSRLRQFAELLAAAESDEASSPVDRAVVFTTPKGPAEARRLKALVSELGAHADERGGERLITPRKRAKAEEE